MDPQGLREKSRSLEGAHWNATQGLRKERILIRNWVGWGKGFICHPFLKYDSQALKDPANFLDHKKIWEGQTGGGGAAGECWAA